MLLHVVRHAHAGERHAWSGDDRDRPLSPRGEEQSRLIAELLEPSTPLVIRSSVARRCVQTVTPLAGKTGVEVVVDDRLFEGNGLTAVEALIDDAAAASRATAGAMVWCTHGDIIPRMLSILVDRGMEPTHELEWRKASIWTVEHVGGAWGAGSYTPPAA